MDFEGFMDFQLLEWALQILSTSDKYPKICILIGWQFLKLNRNKMFYLLVEQ